MMFLLLTFVPLAFTAVIGQGSIDPKVNKAVDSILLIAQNELHHVLNEAVLSVAKSDQDLIAEVEKMKTEKAELEAKDTERKSSEDKVESDSSLSKRFYGYGYGYPYYG